MINVCTYVLYIQDMVGESCDKTDDDQSIAYCVGHLPWEPRTNNIFRTGSPHCSSGLFIKDKRKEFCTGLPVLKILLVRDGNP